MLISVIIVQAIVEDYYDGSVKHARNLGLGLMAIRFEQVDSEE
jgi:hypothetical protein